MDEDEEYMVSWFRRRRARAAEPEAPETVEDVPEPEDAGEAEPSGRGPWDVDDVPELGRRVDLGSVRIPAVQGMELRMEVEKSTQRVTAASIVLRGSVLQVQAFAAPRSEGIWDEIREEIAESVTKRGGSVDDVPGPFGRELLARVPTRTPEGRSGHRPARFIGYDGSRWFLRGVITGKAAVDEDAAAELEDVFAGIVVVRGSEPRPPRELLALTLPRPAGSPQPGTVPGGPVPGAQTGPAPAPTPIVADLDPFSRGPEITEIR